MTFTIALMTALCATGEGTAAVSAEGTSIAAPPNEVVLRISLSKEEFVAGENVDIRMVLENRTDAPAKVAPPQFFAFVMPHVVQNGQIMPSQIRVSLFLRPDITIGPHQSVETWADLGTWYPLGLRSGPCTIGIEYRPDRKDRSVVVYSNAVDVRVRERNETEEEQYQAFRSILRAPSKDVQTRARSFLEKHPGSMFACRVRLEAATRNRPGVQFVDDMLGQSFERQNPTRRELALAREFRARAYEENGRLEEAVALLALIDEPWATRKKAGLERTIALKKEKEQQQKDEVGVSRTP
jgi:hypothetical protein